MQDVKVLPSALLVLCWIAGVHSDNYSLVPLTFANASSTSTTSNTVTTGPLPPPTTPLPVPTYTGNSDDLVDWCFSIYDDYQSSYGTVTLTTSTWSDYVFDGPSSDYTASSTITTGTYTVTTTIVPPGYTSPPQCIAPCQIYGEFVDLFYWPTPRIGNGTAVATITPGPTPSSAVVNGSTLYSPSNYLALTDVSAQVCNYDGSPCQPYGTGVHITTLSFGQNELSTENCMHGTGVLNYEDFNQPIPWSIVTNQYGCTILTETHPGSYLDPTYTLKPSIVWPTRVKTLIDPAWSTCNFLLNLFDPPSALTPVHQLTPGPAPGTTSTSVDPLPTTTLLPTAQPVSTSSPSAPKQTVDPPAPTTSTTAPVPPASTVVPDPPTTTQVPAPASPVDPGKASTVDPATPASKAATQPGDPASPGTPTTTALGSIIASVGGYGGNPAPSSTITLAGSSPAAAVPVPGSSALPSNLGTTTTINNTPVVVIPSATTIPAANIAAGLGSTTTISGTPMVVINPTTIAISSSAAGGGVVEATGAGLTTTIANGQAITLAAGSATTISQFTTSINGKATTIAAQTFSAPFSQSSKTATINGQTITLAPNGASVIVGGQTATKGGAPVTVGGTVVSLGASSLVVGGSTIALAIPTPSSSGGSGSGNATASPSYVQAGKGSILGVSAWGVSLAFSTAYCIWLGV